MPPQPPQGPLQRLPPILRMTAPDSMPSCSKAPRGLFVQSRVPCIFTGNSISPSPLSRQCPSRYALRAGRNLPDKEFRYLRTVIVTAAVYWGFVSELITPPLNLPALGRRQPLYFTLSRLAETCVFGKQSLGPCHCDPPRLDDAWPPHLLGAPLLPKLRGQFAEFLNKGSLDHLSILYLPTSVGLRYGRTTINVERLFSAVRRRRLQSACADLGSGLTSSPGDFPSRTRLHQVTHHVH